MTNCHQLKLVSPKDGKRYFTDVSTQPQLFRIIQSIPSKKAEPFKQWMAQVASDRLDQMQDPELNFEQAYNDYRRLGYSDKWINQRLKSIEISKALTDEWDRAGSQIGSAVCHAYRYHHSRMVWQDYCTIQALQRPAQRIPPRQYDKYGAGTKHICRSLHCRNF